ncbi:MAG TPA: ATP-binding protein [Bacteroidota bacterium]|nr:ATP-binding protein [Bacteroidota bacterium]
MRLTVHFISISLAVATLAYGQRASAQQGGERLEEAWRWVQFTTASGLPSDRIIGLVETGDGILWAHTAGGLATYDGFQWSSVDTILGVPTRGMASVTRYGRDSVLVVSEGRVFLGNRSGFTRIGIGPTYEATPYPPSGILLLDNHSSILRYEGGTVSLFEPSREKTEGKTISIRTTKGGGIWAHLSDGFYRLEGNRWSQKFLFGSRPGVIASLAENAAKTGIAFVIFPLEYSGIWEWSGGGPAVLNRTERPDNVRWIDIGEDDEALVLYQSGAVRIRREGIWSDLSVPGAMIQDINFVLFRPNRDIWFGTEHGLFLYKRTSSRWTFRNHPSPDLRNSINEIIKTRTGDLWIATSGGLEIEHPDHSVEDVNRIGSVPLYVVTGLSEDESGGIWISSGLSFTGAYRWDGTAWTHFDVSGDEGGVHIHKIRRDRHGRLWFLGIGEISPSVTKKEPGAYLYTGHKFYKWGMESGLPAGRVYGFGEAPDGALWFGTAGGLSRWRPSGTEAPVTQAGGTWTHWSIANGLRADRIFTLAVDQENRVWFGDHSVDGNGVGMIGPGDSIRYYTTADGLVNDNIWDISVGGDSAVWVATERGLSSYRHGRWSTFDMQSGLLHPMLWPILPTGDKVYVGTQGRGIAILDLEESNSPVPRIALDLPSIGDRSVVLRWHAYSFWGELDPSEIATRYRINGGPWSAWSVGHSFSIAAIPPGDYRYRVQARGLFGGYSEAGVEGFFTIPQPLWFRPGFFIPTGLLFLVTAGFVAVLLARKRNHDLAIRRSEEKFRTVTETTSSAMFICEGDRIIFVNTAAERLTGYSATRLMEMMYTDILPVDSGTDPANPGSPAGAAEHFETKIRTAGGEERWVDCTAGGIDFQGRTVRLVTAFEITERKTAEQKLRSLASELSLTEERERRRMATYLHDVIGQTLAIIKMHVRKMQKEPLPSASLSSLAEVRDLIDTSIVNTQTLTFDLCPPILYELSFEAAVEWLIEQTQNRHGIACTFQGDGQVKTLPQDIRVLLFQATREVLMNAVKHAEAHRISVSLCLTDGTVRIIVRDDGAGFDPVESTLPAGGGGFGLFNIRERLTHFGGRLVIESRPGAGTDVTIMAPVRVPTA